MKRFSYHNWDSGMQIGLDAVEVRPVLAMAVLTD